MRYRTRLHHYYRVIVAQIMIGFGFVAVPLTYAIPNRESTDCGPLSMLTGVSLATALGTIAGPM